MTEFEAFEMEAVPSPPSRRDNSYSSRYPGVCWDKTNKKWQAYVYHGGKQEHLSNFATEEGAKACYDARCLQLRVDPDAGTLSSFPDSANRGTVGAGSVDINLVRAVQLLVCTRPGQSGQVLVAREARISQAVLSNWLRLQYGGDVNKMRSERRNVCVETVT
jgi:hypothetical protein